MVRILKPIAREYKDRSVFSTIIINDEKPGMRNKKQKSSGYNSYTGEDSYTLIKITHQWRASYTFKFDFVRRLE